MFTVPDLPYAYNALEPFISTEIMTLHHTKHHAAYVAGLNAATQQYATASTAQDIESQISLQAALKFNGGGHINHSLFWKNLCPANSADATLQDNALSQAITRDFGSLDAFKAQFNAKITTIQGSGWGWLGKTKGDNPRLEILTTANQDPLTSHTVILGVDAWEHAFYLQYKNVKVEYFKAIWNVVNWSECSKRFEDNQSASKI